MKRLKSDILTRGGVYKNICESHYIKTIVFNNVWLSLYFTSSNNLNIFNRKYDNHLKNIKQSLDNRFKPIIIDSKLLAIFQLYLRCEKRSVLIKYNQELIKCQEDMILKITLNK